MAIMRSSPEVAAAAEVVMVEMGAVAELAPVVAAELAPVVAAEVRAAAEVAPAVTVEMGAAVTVVAKAMAAARGTTADQATLARALRGRALRIRGIGGSV